MPEWEAVIGLEVHAQLRTRSKIFCGCAVAFGAPPNSLTCPVCLGHPGALPRLNREAVRLAVRAARAFGCDVSPRSVFARKNYFYPDLPKGYQITQYDEPLATGGSVAIEVDGRAREIPLERLHIEEDAGKMIHDAGGSERPGTRIDFNRAGVPLVEIVTRPDLRTPEEAHAVLERLRSVLRYIEVCDGNLEEGSLRCDANVSVRVRGSDAMGARAELKNLNSLRNVERALSHEIERQSRALASSEPVERETVLWDARAGATRAMRGKEETRDYRYFPDPDLPPLLVGSREIARAEEGLPELPAPRKARFIRDYGLSESIAHRLTLERPVADYFESANRSHRNPSLTASLVLNDLRRLWRRSTREDVRAYPPPEHLGDLIRLVDAGSLSLMTAREILVEMHRTRRSPGDLVRGRDLEPLSDGESLRDAVARVIESHPAAVARYRSGKEAVLHFLVGEVLRATGGRARPSVVLDRVREALAGPR